MMSAAPRLSRAIWASALRLTTALAVITPCAEALADEARAEAQRLFDEASAAMDGKRFDEACPKLERVLQLQPGKVGTLLALGECYEGAQKLRAAWTAYKGAGATAAATGDPRAARAEAKIAELAAKLSTLTVSVGDAVLALPGLEVRRNGALLDVSRLGAPEITDPGPCEISVTAPGKRTSVTRVELSPGRSSHVEIGALADLPAPPIPAPPSFSAAPLPAPQQPFRTLAAAEGNPTRVPLWAWGAGAGGVVLTAGAIGFLVDQLATQRTFDRRCKRTGYDDAECDDLEGRLYRDFGLWIGLGSAGLAALGLGAYGFGKAVTARPSVSVGPAGVLIGLRGELP